MIQNTLKDVLPTLRRVASQAGMRADDARLKELVNSAQETLLSKVPNLVGSMHRLKFRQYDDILALPGRYQRLVKLSVDRSNAPVMDKWYEFMDFGPGQVTDGQLNVAVDRGESPVVRQLKAQIRCYGYVDERVSGVRPKIRILGYDEYGRWVRSLESGNWVNGEAIEINGDGAENFTTTTTKWSRITQVVKPVTRGTVELYYYDETAEPQTIFAARYEHWETNPSFRLYQAPAVSEDGSVIHALCKVRFRPVLEDTDALIVSSLPALKKAFRALAAEEADDEVKAENNWALAKQLLVEQAKDYYGSPNPPVDVARISGGFGGIPQVL